MKKKKKNILAWPVFKYDSQPTRDQIVNELQSMQDVVDVQSLTDTQDVINDDMVKRGEQLTQNVHGMHEVHEVNDVRSVESLTPDIATSLTDIRSTITDSQNISNIQNLTDNILAR